MTIVGAKVIANNDELVRNGGTNGQKFVKGLTTATRDTVTALCNDLHDKVDARDVAGAVNVFASSRGIKRANLHEDLGTNRTKIKELHAIAKICSSVNEAIDTADHWPTHENLYYVALGKADADQLGRWQTILDPATRSAKSRRSPPKSRTAIMETIVSALEKQLEFVERLDDTPLDNALTEVEQELCKRFAELVKSLSEIFHSGDGSSRKRSWFGRS